MVGGKLAGAYHAEQATVEDNFPCGTVVVWVGPMLAHPYGNAVILAEGIGELVARQYCIVSPRRGLTPRPALVDSVPFVYPTEETFYSFGTQHVLLL